MKIALIPLILLVSFQCISAYNINTKTLDEYCAGYYCESLSAKISTTTGISDLYRNRTSCIPSIAFSDTLNCVDSLTVVLDSNAEYVLRPDEIYGGSADDFKIDTIYLDNYNLNCSNIGITKITLTAIDELGKVATCETNMTVYGNAAPNVVDDSAITVMNNPIEIDIIANDFDSINSINFSSLSIIEQPANGIIEINPINGNLTYTPSLGFIGKDIFTYSICDDGIPCVPMCGSAAVYIEVVKSSNYYASAEGLSGDNLKSALHNIIKDHVEFSYTSSNTDTWDILKETDKDTANPDNVILFYSGWSVNAAQEYNDGLGYSREHVWAKSHGDFGTDKGAGTDVHHLRPADISVNSARNNKDFDTGGEIYVDGDGTTECKSDADSWEPRDAVKGDIARMLFYMAVRYEGTNGDPDLELEDAVNTFDLNESGKGYHGKLSTLLEWHKADPVDSFEIHRNDIIYSYQENRNPFIDHPEFVSKLWTITGTSYLQEKQIKIYPNPACEFVNIELPINEFAQGKIYSTSGETVLNFKISASNKISIACISSGIYFLQVVTLDQVYKSKLIIEK
ncbi:MAG: endonuclease [Bacteroidetes bacterium]|nr:endonuclease [Bacteroidota bacterium]